MTETRCSLLAETLMPLAEAFQEATGRRPSPASLHRWRLRGVRGVRIRAVRIGARWYSSAAEVRRFVASLTEAGSTEPSSPPCRRQQIQRAEDKLKKRGL